MASATLYRSCLLVFLLQVTVVLAQISTGSLSGIVTDPSGAVIPGAMIVLRNPNIRPIVVATDKTGAYEIKGLQPGRYTVNVTSKGFSALTRDVDIAAGETPKVILVLAIAVSQEEVEVESEGSRLSTSPDRNGGRLVLSGNDLDALSDDPDELQAELMALAGPAPGPNGGQIYIDGFTGGQLPPKASIRDVRINQNPFSAEYERLGFGRIDIVTKPGTDQFHGQLFFDENNKAFNTQNPFVTNQPGYNSELMSGNIGGPLSKHASFFANVEWRSIDDTNPISATTSGSNLTPESIADAIPNPRTRTAINIRVDDQVRANNTLTTRYQFVDIHEVNDGVGLFSLASQGYNRANTENTVQLADTQILNQQVINETRFEYQRGANDLNAQSGLPEILVQGAFTGGGNPIGSQSTISNHYELQNYTSMVKGNHLIKFGGRLRLTAEAYTSTQNFNGTYIFPSLTAYDATLRNPTSIFPAQFSIATGDPSVTDALVDAGVFGQDDWKVRPNFTLTYGIRVESQNDIHDHADVAPRFGLAWGIDSKKNKAPKTLLRAGYGIFYDRFPQSLVIQADQLNGTHQVQFIDNSPAFFNSNMPPPLSQLSQVNASTFRLAPNLRAPYVMQTAVGLERQLTKSATVTVNYLNSRGLHQLITDNINAPQPNSAVAFPNLGPVYQFESVGIFKQEQLTANLDVRAGTKLTLFGLVIINNAHSDTAGPSTFPSNQFDISQDYGRTPFDIRYRIFFGGTVGLPRGFRVNPFLIFNSGQPFNIIVGDDRNNDSIFNDRPFFANNPSQPGAVVTSFGTLDPNPLSGERVIPPYLGTGPNQFTFNFRVGKTFAIRKGQQESDPGHSRAKPTANTNAGQISIHRPYNLTISISARNLFNNINLAPPVGILTSPRFDQSIALAGGNFSTSDAVRRVDLQVTFSF